jgi:L-methionine (R)-S-oxide reductase
LVVPDVHLYPSHIACDGDTNSEIVIPLILHQVDSVEHVLGVLDLDCLAKNGFDEDDKLGLEKIMGLIVRTCDW